MEIIFKGVKPTDYSLLLELAKRLGIQTKIIQTDNTDLPDHVIAGVKKALKESDTNQISPYKGIRDMLSK